MRHIVVMTSTGAAGLMALFLVDLADMFFLSLLGEAELAAAVGFAGTLLFFTTSVTIGLSIAAGALVSQAIGAGKRRRAARTVTNVFFLSLVITVPAVVLFLLATPTVLSALGAQGRTFELAVSYLYIVVPSMPALALGMCSGGVLRALGDAKSAMRITLLGGAVNAVLDPIFIFVLDMGMHGAAWASVCARCAIFGVGAYGVCVTHKLLPMFRVRAFIPQVRPILRVALPAVLTNIATPVGAAFVTASIAKFGDGAVAGAAVIARVTPVAFGLVLALSGAVGPIIGQNFGAHRLDRVSATYWNAIKFTIFVVTFVVAVLFAAQDLLISWFKTSGEAAELIAFFCTYTAVGFLFNGVQFVGNASFNNLGYPQWSTWSNWGKATLGTLPFVWLGSVYGEAPGVLVGQMLGSLLFALLSLWVANGLIVQLGRRASGDQRRITFSLDTLRSGLSSRD